MVFSLSLSRRKLNTLSLSRHTQLLEVLEIPQVMETCVRNGYYEEALDLSAHVHRMDKKHGSIPIIKVSSVLKCLAYSNWYTPTHVRVPYG